MTQIGDNLPCNIKYFIQTSVFIFSLIFTLNSLAAEPKITETESGFIVEYTGAPETKKPELNQRQLTNTQREEILHELDETISRLKGKRADTERRLQDINNTPKPEDEIKVSAISAMETSRSYGYVTYSLKIDIDNKGDQGSVFIKLVGKNRDGHQIDSAYLTGEIDRHSSKTMTSTTMLSYQHAMDVRTWEVDSIRKYKK